MKKREFTQEEKNDILNKYQNEQWTQKRIGEYYSVSRTVIKRLLKEFDVSLRKKTNKYCANYNIFEEIDSSEKAYWLGFLAADGCNYIRDKNASIILSIHQKDIEHLEKFKKFCETNAEIKMFLQNWGFSNKTPMCKIVLNSVKMSKDLINKGIIPNKSLELKKPNINEEYYKPFILGYFDGDGSIYKTTQGNNYNISIQGTKEILEWINDILNIGKLEKRNNDNKNNYYIRCGGTNKPYNILKQLYESCDIHLDRKYNIYKSLETVVLNRNIKRLLECELLESLKVL